MGVGVGDRPGSHCSTEPLLGIRSRQVAGHFAVVSDVTTHHRYVYRLAP